MQYTFRRSQMYFQRAPATVPDIDNGFHMLQVVDSATVYNYFYVHAVFWREVVFCTGSTNKKIEEDLYKMKYNQ